MPVSPSWKARLRPEYRWPYPRLDPATWYPVRTAAEPLEPAKYVWLDCEPYPVEVFAEHLEPLRCDPEDDRALGPAGSGVVVRRLARLRATASSRHPGVPPGAWVPASVLTALAGPVRSEIEEGGRRRHRLPEADFDFRTEERAVD